MSMEKYYEEFVKGKSSEEIMSKIGDVALPGSRVYEMMKDAARIKAIKENQNKNKGKFNHPAFKILGIIGTIITIIVGIVALI